MPQIGLPQREPVIRQISVKIAPTGATALLIIKPKEILKDKLIILYIVIIRKVNNDNQADGTCIYIILTIDPC